MILQIEKRRMVSLRDDFIQEIGDCFMRHTDTLQSISLSSVRTIGDWFMIGRSLQSIDLPMVETVGTCFIFD
jgi:hypothetical protein